MKQGGIQGSEMVVCITVMMDAWHYTFVKPLQCITQEVNPNVNCGFQSLMMNQQWFIDCINVHRARR